MTERHRILLTNLQLVDVRSGKISKQSISIIGNRIEAIGVAVHTGDRVLDLEGLYLLQGLINVHAHLSISLPYSKCNELESPAVTALRCYRRGIEALQAGITTVRTVSEIHRADIPLREAIQRGELGGPRIYSGGRGIAITGGHGAGYGVLTGDGADGIRALAREEFAAGADHLKIFLTGGIADQNSALDEPQMTKLEAQAAVEVAASRGTYVTAHASGGRVLAEALEVGLGCCEHGYFLNADVAKLMHRKYCPLVPTLCVTRSPDWMRQNQFEEWWIQKSLESASDHMTSIRTAIKAGVTLLVGTDVPPGDSVDGNVNVTVREIENLAEAGLSNLEALQAATIHPAKLMKAKIGVIKEGKFADLIAVPSNPVKDVCALRDIVLVIKGGGIVKKAGSSGPCTGTWPS